MHSKDIFHFDLKPENILYESGSFKLIDFGSVPDVYSEKWCVMAKNSKFAMAIQTTQLFSSLRVDSVKGMVVCDKYDVYSLGCLLFNMLTN